MATAAKKQTKTDAICAVVGSDDAEVKRHAKQLAQDMAPAGDDLACEIIDGAVENAEQGETRIFQTIEALLTLPFFGGDKLVWLKNANFLSDSATGRAAGVLAALEKLVETLERGLPSGVRLLISAPEIDKRRSFYKSLGKLGDVKVFDKLDISKAGWEEEVSGVVRQRARDLGLTFQGDALNLFVLQTGGDSRQIDNELEKLSVYLGAVPGEVNSEQVRLLVPASRASVIFELGNALTVRDLRHALGLVEQLLFQGETAVGILLVAIIPTVRNLLLAKDLMQRHRLSKPSAPFHFTGAINRLPAQATQHLPRKKDGTVNTFALGLAAMGAHRYELHELTAALQACLEANVLLVTSGLEARTILTELVVKIATPSKPPRI